MNIFHLLRQVGGCHQISQVWCLAGSLIDQWIPWVVEFLLRAGYDGNSPAILAWRFIINTTLSFFVKRFQRTG